MISWNDKSAHEILPKLSRDNTSAKRAAKEEECMAMEPDTAASLQIPEIGTGI